ncbi:radical S-adenosyl methionine domain-containing protein 1, mitochondrial isoform X4 [Hydra vulgaris]|uniref:Radical S-adenosyl methionine domain-containing protein 1, mitochondrial n=1 Tax=Hydra vulgaris TaxID=6087 RepID=A0ABM4CDG3_HYDVU
MILFVKITRWSWRPVQYFLKKRNAHETKTATLYIHWPYCKQLCPYCNFNKYVRDNIDNELMIKCLLIEFQSMCHMYDVKKIKSVYFGGGTPSLAPPKLINRLLEEVCKHTNVNCEISMEVNPTSTEKKKLSDFKSAGINRVSIGVQALNDRDLKVLGREHNVQEALNCFEHAYDVFSANVSIDIMFGRTNQTLDDWIFELTQIIALKSKHLSLYQLTMKQGTPMEKQYKKGQLKLPTCDTLADMYEIAVKMLEEKSIKRYEVSNFAEQGFECCHNLSYWQGEDYIGIGPGAHGRLHTPNGSSRHALVQIAVPEDWIKQVQKDKHGTRLCKTLTIIERREEAILLALRSSKGLDKKFFMDVVGWPVEELQKDQFLNNFLEGGFLHIDNSGLKCSHKGMLLVDSIALETSLAIDRITSNFRHLA